MLKRFAFVVSILAAACGDDGVDPPLDPQVSLSADSVSVTVGGTTLVTATVKNSTVAPQFVSRNANVALVSTTGTISGIQAGTTWVVVSLPNSSARDSVRVAVTQSGVAIPTLGTGVVAERWTAEVAAAGAVAYTTTWGSRTVGVRGNAIKIWNVSGNAPLLTDSIVLPNVGTISDIQISDDGTLLVASTEGGGSANNGLFIFDRTNAARPTQIIKYTSANTAPGVHTVKLGRVNGRHYAFLNIDPPARLVILDITNPSAPVETFVQLMGNPFIHDVFVRDGVLFAALWDDGLRIFDIGGAGRGGTPSVPVTLGTVRTVPCKVCAPNSSSVHNVWWFHDPTNGTKRYAFIGEEGFGSVGQQRSSGAVHVVDVSNLDAPREVAIFEPDSTTTANGLNAGAHNFVMDEPSGILYAAFYNGGVRALDARGDLSACTAAQKTAAGLCDLALMGRERGIALNSNPPRYVWGVALVGNALYASDMHVGIHKLDISGLKR